MLKTVIIEDEVHILNMMAYFINENDKFKLIGTFSNPLDALQQVPLLDADVLFIDIEMPFMKGIDLAKRLKTNDNQIVFTTAYEQYALEAFQVQATEYLLKPIIPEAIAAITDRLIKTKEVNRLLATVEKKEAYPFIQCFGTFKVINQEKIVVKWPTRKTEELFAYMLTHSYQIINKWAIVDTIWPEKDGERALHNVHNAVYLLKKTIKEYNLPISVLTINDGYSLEFIEQVFVDLFAFQELDADTKLMDHLLEVTNQYSDSGALFLDRDYHWSVLLKEKLEMKHREFLRKLQLYYEELDVELAKELKDTYKRLYEVEL